MKPKEISITSDALNELFRYEPDSGNLFWRESASSRARAGDEAGCLRPDGYRKITINGRHYLSHRLIWIMVYGEISGDLQIDHINGIKNDNRIDNIRLVTGQQNQHNHTKAKGCYWYKNVRKWRAQIGIGGKIEYLGFFDDKADARAAYLEAKKKHHRIEL